MLLRIKGTIFGMFLYAATGFLLVQLFKGKLHWDTKMTVGVFSLVLGSFYGYLVYLFFKGEAFNRKLRDANRPVPKKNWGAIITLLTIAVCFIGGVVYGLLTDYKGD